MDPVTARTQSLRKRPSQARSSITVDAVIEATLQVLRRDGYARLTTTRVAERAGVSVGSVYQYFPNRRALIAELVRRHLAAVAEATSTAVLAERASPLPVLVRALVTGFVEAKRAGLETARLLQPALADIDSAVVIREITQRAIAGLAAVLQQRPEFAGRGDAGTIAEVLTLSITAPVSAWVIEDPARLEDPGVRDHLLALALGYLEHLPHRR